MSVDAVLKEMVDRSFEEIERVVLASPDGSRIGASNPSDFDDVVAALGAAIMAGVGEAFTQYFKTGVKEVLIELKDERVMLVRDLGGPVICLVSKPRPNLGLIYLLLDRYAGRVRESMAKNQAPQPGA